MTPNMGDWDCNGKVEKLYKKVECLIGIGNDCFMDDPDCGTTADFYTCSGVTAVKDKQPRTQACR